MNTFHKILFVLAILIANCISASAIEFTVDGVRYSVNNDNTTVTVAGYPSGSKPIGDLTIPESVTYGGISYPVTSIGNKAFFFCSGLTSVTIPNSVTEIGIRAFYNCEGLMSVTIPNSVTSIGYYAFQGCSGLTSVNIPNSVTSIGYYAFQGCSALTSVNIPNSVTEIGDGAFDGTKWYDNQPDGLVYAGPVAYKYKGTMASGTCIVLKEGTKGIAGSAFSGCSGLTSITIPSTVKYIGRQAFSSSDELTEVVWNAVSCNIDYTLESSHPFYSCSIMKLIVGDKVQQIPSYLMDKQVLLKSVTIGNSVTSIGEGAFRSCSGLTSVTIPNSVTSIGKGAFEDCSGLKSVTIPNSVTSIGEQAFYDCRGLTSVTIGNSVTSIGEGAFYECSGLTSVVWNAKNCSDFSYNSRPFNDLTNIKTFEFGSEVERIPAYLCDGLTDLTSVTIPNSVTKIGDNAFYECLGLTSVTIGNSVTSIGNKAFYFCSGLTSVTIPNSVTSIGDMAFLGCSGLTRIDAYPNPEKVSTGGNVFYSVPKNETLHVLPKYMSAYRTASQWRDFTNIKGDLTENGGDINLDGKVNVTDVTTLVNMIANGETANLELVDINADGKVNVSDVTALVNIILK